MKLKIRSLASYLLTAISFILMPLLMDAQNTTTKTLSTQPHCTTCHQGAHDGFIEGANAASSISSQSTRHTRPGNGNSTFGQSYLVQNLCGMNYTYGSTVTQTRATWQPGTGFPTTVAIAGLPAGFVVQQAYVYYGCSYTEPTPPATSVNMTNPAAVNNVIASTMIGQGGDVCWATTGTCGYRCDVTSMISGNGNYTIDLPGFANEDYEVDGVTLIVVYVDPAATYSGSIVFWDGLIYRGATNITQPGNYTWNGFTACTASSSASAFGLFGDMQNNVGNGMNTEDFNGSTATFTNDFWNTDVVATSVAACQTSAVYDAYVGNSSDCWLGVMEGLYWQYSTCTACSAMTVTDIAVNPSCGNNNGSITLTVVGGTAPFTYTWTPAVSTTSSATGLAPGTYQVSVQDAGCNIQTISVTLVMVTLNVSDVQTNIKCNGQTNGTASFIVSGGTTPYTYTWNPNVSSTSSATGLSAGAYTVVIEDNVGCTFHDTITITQPPVLTAPIVAVNENCNGGTNGSATTTAGGGTPPYTYAWSNGSTVSSATNLSAGTYTLILTDSNGCSISPTVSITEPTSLSVNITGPQVICIGQSGTLSAIVTGGTSPYNYAWSNGPTTSNDVITPTFTATYTVNITDANGCTAMSTVNVAIGAPLVVTITGPSSTCSGNPVTFCGTVSGGTGGTTYTWNPGNISGSCLTVSPTTTTVYSLTVGDNCGSDTTVTKTILINPLPQVNFATDNNQGCSPLCIQFRDLTTLTSGYATAWSWRFGNGDSLETQNPIYCYPNSGEYSVDLTVTSDSGCSSTLKILNMITVYTHPVSAFSVSPQPTTIIAPKIQFTNKSSDKYDIAFWYWTFGDSTDNTSSLENPTHTYSDTGTYCARLVTMNIHGCTDTTTNCLVIDPIFDFYIPSAFSPNGDGKNDVFMPVGSYIKNYEMYIFDRWGMQLFHTTDIFNGWNGTVKGGTTIAQEDTYIYKINVTDSKGKNHSYIGDVSLIK